MQSMDWQCLLGLIVRSFFFLEPSSSISGLSLYWNPRKDKHDTKKKQICSNMHGSIEKPLWSLWTWLAPTHHHARHIRRVSHFLGASHSTIHHWIYRNTFQNVSLPISANSVLVDNDFFLPQSYLRSQYIFHPHRQIVSPLTLDKVRLFYTLIGWIHTFTCMPSLAGAIGMRTVWLSWMVRVSFSQSLAWLHIKFKPSMIQFFLNFRIHPFASQCYRELLFRGQISRLSWTPNLTPIVNSKINQIWIFLRKELQ